MSSSRLLNMKKLSLGFLLHNATSLRIALCGHIALCGKAGDCMGVIEDSGSTRFNYPSLWASTRGMSGSSA